MYCSNCIDTDIIPPIPQLKRQNAELYIPTSDNFICAHCKTNVILCNVTHTTQTKKLNITRLQEYDKCLQILNFLMLDV
jgi:hypothetical protein